MRKDRMSYTISFSSNKLLFKLKSYKGLRWFLRNIGADASSCKKILIANRGEIACRIIRSAKKMDIKTVAVFSTADASSVHVKLADEAVCIGPPPVQESYLNIEHILEVIRKTNVDAVHPGYGFLSESTKFVQLLERENITFIGPSANIIFKMGDKLESKKTAMEAGVKTIPGFDGVVPDAEQCVRIAEEIGYPVMIKASAGGGGKGMRIAASPEEVIEGYRISRQEALSTFGDDRMLVEKYIENPRHIEIQVLCDNHGNGIYLNERECSIQRRNQKVIEEAPSVFLDESTRKAMGDQAISLCKRLGYTSAGTIEFLVDDDKNFYFLEMNTRLQVEHPITECITGIDIVEQMIRISRGEKLQLKQDDVKIDGWAIESRVYAEDPFRQLGLPSVGRLYKYMEPTNLPGVRCDSGIEEGSDISIYYDPLICKLVCHGKDREEAIRRSIKALDSYVIRGVTHNIPLLRDVLGNEHFIQGKISTNFLNNTYPSGFKGARIMKGDKTKLAAVGSILYASEELRENKNKNYMKNMELVAFVSNEEFKVKISDHESTFKVSLENEEFVIKRNFNTVGPIISISINEEDLLVQLQSKNVALGEFDVIHLGTSFSIRVMTKDAADFLHLMPKITKPDFSNLVKSPMPGLIVAVSCKAGDVVQEGQELCIVEAMKMRNSITSPIEGRLKKVNVKAGDTVADGNLLMEFE